jgi:hypothetical protein
MTYNFDFRKIAVWIVVVLMWVCVMMMAFSCSAQTWNNFKGIRLVNNSDTTKQLAVQGSLFFDDQLDSLYLYDGTKWINLSKGAYAPTGAFWPLSGQVSSNNDEITFSESLVRFSGADDMYIESNNTLTFRTSGTADIQADAFTAVPPSGDIALGYDNVSAFLATGSGAAYIVRTDGSLEIITGNGVAALRNLPVSTTPANERLLLIDQTSEELRYSTAPAPSSGTYTPTVTLSTNVSAATVTSALYTRIGDIVTLTLEIQGSFNGTGVGMLFFTIPFTTANSLVQNAGVVSGERSDNTALVGIVGLNNGTRAAVTFNGGAFNGTSFDVGVVFTYIVQ